MPGASVGDYRAALTAWIDANRPPNSTRAYSTYGRQYVAFASQRVLPLDSPVTLAAFMHHGLRVRGLGRNTLVSAIPTAVAHIFRYSESTPTVDPLIREVKRTIRRLTPHPSHKLPITTAQLTRMVGLVTPNFCSIRNMFLLILMFLGFLRESEATALRRQDVWTLVQDGRSLLFIFIEKSKVDQIRHGHTVVMEASPSSPLCPVRWFRLYASLYPRAGAPFVFLSVKKGHRRLASTTPARVILECLRAIGVDPAPYGSHSLRRGGVTAAVAAGVQMHVIARHGNWRSNAVFAYVSDTVLQRLAVSRALIGGRQVHR